MATLDVTEAPYHANGDGTGNDYGAINAALRDCGPDDTVYIPAGTYNVHDSGRVFDLTRMSGFPKTIEGDGPDTTLRLSGPPSGPFLRTDGQQVVIRDIHIDGQRRQHGDHNENGIVFWRPSNPGSVGPSLLENVHVEGFSGTNISIRTPNVTIRNCTSSDAGRHGLGYRDNNAHSPGLVVENSLFEANAQYNRGFYNLDVATGRIRIRDTVSSNSNGGATKTSHTGEVDVRYERFRAEGAGSVAYQSTNGNYGTVVFEDCVFGPNNRGQMRLSNINYVVEGELVVTGNHSNGIYTTSGGRLVSADEIWCNNNGGTGLGGGPGSVDVYHHHNNDGGPGGSGYSIGQTNEDEKTDLENVPTADDVGAWANPGGSDDDSGEEEEEEEANPAPTAALATNGGALYTAGGVITTVGSSLQRVTGTVVEDFESYPSGTPLEDTDAWHAAGSYSAAHEVTDRASTTGDQALVVTGANSYNAIQSTGGLGEYPAADCTIRLAVYLESGSHDVAFGVPASEDNYHLNCYRLRGGPLLSRNPSLKRTVDGEMEVLVSLDNHFPTGTWLEHVIEFENTGSEVVLTYNGYAWDDDAGEWVQFEADARGVDPDATFANETGIGLGTYMVGSDVTAFDNIRVSHLGDTDAPNWTPR